jgi:hypothetical protein
MAVALVGTAHGGSGNVYDRSGRLLGTIYRQSDGSVVSNANGGERSVDTRNGYTTYSPSGQMTRYGVWVNRSTMRHYSPDGRYLGHTSKRNGVLYHYDPSGQLRATGR